uniref:Uncharacterized protein n=1 Tax=Triparma laevis TaxID=1534972 RepID=A0A0K2RWD1_9STRA|nr:hypothetical protein AL373_pgp064 [Triparma laevis]BAS19095.1 hypothetical protein [Triparma laevis]
MNYNLCYIKDRTELIRGEVNTTLKVSITIYIL